MTPTLETRDDGRCPLCRAPEFDVFLEIPAMPVHVGVLWTTADAARDCGRGDLALAYCRRCGFVANRAFDPGLVDYSLSYDNALHHSAVFREYEEGLARGLVERHGLHDKDVVEIGCGGGRFLGMLCELGGNRGTGFDPSHEPEAADPGFAALVREGRARVVRDYYGDAYADHPADLVCSRHALEHVSDPSAMVAGVRKAVAGKPDAVVYFEVPNALFIFRDLSIWDFIYEHCGYYAPETLAAFFRRAGFSILDCREDYEGQFLGLEARRAPPAEGADALPPPEVVAALSTKVAAFAAHFERLRDAWRRRLAECAAAGRRVAVWGAGAKTVSFLNLLASEGRPAPVEALVDVNPAKQGTFLAGTGHAIQPPEALRACAPDLVIVMNAAYREEIAKDVRDMGLDAELATVTVEP